MRKCAQLESSHDKNLWLESGATSFIHDTTADMTNTSISNKISIVICRCPVNMFSSVSQLELSCWPHRLIIVVSIELQANYVSHKRDLTNIA